jgi:DNA-binding GntR family transcriptional regulator
VYERLRRLIVRGRLAPGARVTELGVAERLGVSRTPVREALQRLRQDGLLVATTPSSRAQLAVAPLVREEMVELYGIAAALEGLAVRAVAGRPASERRAVASDLQTLNERFAAEIRRAASDRDLDELFERHNAFHELVVAQGAGPRLRDQLAAVRPLLDRYEWYYAPLAGPDHEVSVKEHEAVVRAVRAGDPDAADAALRANWWNSAERLAGAIDSVGGRGGEW